MKKVIKTKKPRSSNMFRKFFAATAGIVLSSFIFLGSAFLVFSMRYWTRDKLSLLAENTQRAAELTADIYTQGGGEQSAFTRGQLLHSFLRSTSETLDAEFFICNTEGRIVGCPEEVPETLRPAPVRCTKHAGLRLSEGTVTRALAEPYRTTGTLEGAFAQQMLVSLHPFSLDGEPAGFVMAVQPVSEGLAFYLGGVMRLFLLSALVVLALTFVVIYYISYRLVRPVREMVRATRQYAKGDFSYRVSAKENDELSQLADAFNHMAVSLATLESSRRSFVANVSHELKTPMTTIGGFIDGMRDGTIPPERHAHYLELVSGEVKRLARLVTGMLNLSKMEAGEFHLNPSAFDINELLFHTVLSFEQLIAKKNIELIGLEDLQPILLHGDRDMLYQVFYNLIDNAVKFTPPGERMEFYVQIHRQKGAEAERIFCFGLRNTGIGIASEELARIFERFYKADKSRSYDVKGAGLGLYLAKTIVEMHGGQLKADSDGVSYTEFAVLLPLESEPE
ncbi:MAG: HAMP domain-containing histidine kinase [Oscillospiraceae bacterium]|jgi:signal transduction histidine kinase|nr:HAMP domain-containing histidine kinase [Oscillospiraceae bacterium]